MTFEECWKEFGQYAPNDNKELCRRFYRAALEEAADAAEEKAQDYAALDGAEQEYAMWAFHARWLRERAKEG